MSRKRAQREKNHKPHVEKVLKMQNLEVNKRDHNYSETNQHNNGNSQIQHPQICDVSRNDKMGMMRKETYVGQIKDINELKKIAPRIRLHDAKSLNELTRISLSNKPPSKLTIPERTRQELKKYCRTCAGLKLPLVDIFSEKGIQMRLSQQIRHLEEIHPYDSLSTQMCMDCICDLKMSYKFFMQIKKAEVKLKSIHITLTDNTTKKLESLNEIQHLETKQDTEQKLTLEATEKKQLSLRDQKNMKNQEESPVPKISAIFSLKDEFDTTDETDEKSKVEPGIFEELIEETAEHHSDDNESIEEFDPDDPPFHPGSSDAGETDDETENEITPLRRHASKKDMLKSLAVSSENDATVYKYDMDMKSYVRMDGIEDATSTHWMTSQSKGDSENQRDVPKEIKQPNILKRRLLMPTRSSIENDNVYSSETSISNECKVQKLDLNNPLCLNNTPEEDGIMYVTVKGSKPNEILLVKVKKMDKPMEQNREPFVGRTTFDMKPMERLLKRYELVTKDFPERTKRPDARDQIIEEQIEEYKKKREKVLGNNSGISSILNETRKESQEIRQNVSEDDIVSLSNFVKIDGEGTSCKERDDHDQINRIDLTTNRKSSSDHEKAGSTEEYLSRLTKLKLKWEEAKKKKESLQKELDQSYTEGNLEKLARILGEKEKNLQEFQEYLKQRKIVITRLKDEDIISLYEDRNNVTLKQRSLPDLIDESQPPDYIPEERYLECDYCPETFASRDVLEEHLKNHDYKIMHFCEDCGEEFPTNKAKRNHNIICMKKLICKYCDIILDSRGKKRQHEQKHSDNLYGQLCDVCGEKFKHQGTLDQHVKTQHMSLEKIFQCPKCPKKFAFKQKLSFHLKSVHTTLRAYLCEDCGADFKNPASLRHHRIRKHQPVGNKRECPVCRKLVPFYSLSKHMHTHKAYTIQCPHCDKMFKNSSTLKQHVRIHEDQRQYRCDTCGVGFNRRDGLRLHMRVHEKTDSRGLKECSCQVCGEKFPNHSTLVIHRNRVHKDGRQYTCHICNRSMISTRSLEWHMSHIHNESLPGMVRDESTGVLEKKRVSCYHCSKTFKTEMILRTHIKNTHMEKDPMKCLDCELTFTSEVRLRHHMMVTHNRLEGTLACPHCPKRFVNQLRLKTHMISHSEERPYTCEICGFNLKTKIQLIKHHQNRHSDERPLQCRYCPWRCKQVSALVCHERTHTNERPYSCSVCRQRFKYLGDKNKHERRHESLGGSGFKRIVPGRNIKPKIRDDSSGSEPDQDSMKDVNPHSQIAEEQYEEQADESYEQKFQEEQIVKFETEQIVKFEGQEIPDEYEQVYEQEYEETSREASEATEVIMNMEDTNVYTEEVTADNMESAEIMTDEMMTNDILQSGAVVHLQQQDDSGKIQMIPVMISLPDLSDANAEVNLATASIMYNN